MMMMMMMMMERPSVSETLGDADKAALSLVNDAGQVRQHGFSGYRRAGRIP
ncbi:uncharacterized protein ACLA_032660 [Aspergillus clavatus NRRL 1]|uniref:Uncharacterized protein n=1 Tax=Aspergillus clavatus (strain ATCC 1007 / CBS 513.65 / DSM 816 / NCTC 3887 / NRRL 1 / QM 1276 / 107) TaxID=344612 RepID=A1CSA9_ASPCL|nr:uncharacterized protein ACLA_032660 [Aspergillus clavatus NRRL 1]EAW08530.1 hypothetical protein ACLA_032660 [Aspergillus clavatus NRRL 1]